jgi:DNA repair photolyase
MNQEKWGFYILRIFDIFRRRLALKFGTEVAKMGLNKTNGNMYGFITHTWNPIKGLCLHGCSYCYMNKIYKRFGKTPGAPHLDDRDLRLNLGKGNFIFIGSSCDMFAGDIPEMWIRSVLEHARTFSKNRYFFQTKNTYRLFLHMGILPDDVTVCTTLETNRDYRPIMGTAMTTMERAVHLAIMTDPGIKRQITIEPVLDFDMDIFVERIKMVEPEQINIGADSGRNNLPEPPREKILDLMAELQKFTRVVCKPNLERIIAS